ncbi:uncharacterized protein V1510DRAFT_313068 [Dipodascopsis tothii]|uniref:uncharacterized protein n=1 Tax=Dipodascopsis tothii TaxID=44089 RepID=UPI0034CE651A
MQAIECSGLPSPNPSIDDICFEPLSPRCDKKHVEEEEETLDNGLVTPNSEEALSSDENETEYPFPSYLASLLYPDTAPRESWRPQVESWIRRNHSYKFDRSTKPYSKKPTTGSKHTSNSHSHSVHSPTKVQVKAKPDPLNTGLRTPSPSVSPSPTSVNKVPTTSLSANHTGRRCISCGSDQSPCWRPSWSVEAGQLCNSCGLRYKKTGARCLSSSCGRIPAKGEWMTMKSTQSAGRYTCLYCGGGVAVGENTKR